MSTASCVTLERATPADHGLLSNLLELYLHDLSEVFPIKVGADGRFGYDHLSQYWTDPDNRAAFLIRVGDELAGFCMMTRGSPASDDPNALDVAEFFVLRGHRRGKVGQQAAFRLWDTHPGRWVVRVSEFNRTGLPFWRRIIYDYTHEPIEEGEFQGSLSRCKVYIFHSR